MEPHYKTFQVSDWAVKNRATVWVITTIILLGGLIAYYAMPREDFPEIIETKIYVSSSNPGNSAEDVERLITEPLEEELENISGVNKITSSSYQDYSIIIVEFDENIELNRAKQDIKDKVDQVKADSEWPTIEGGVKVEPNVFDLNISEATPIMNINLSGENYTKDEIRDFAERLEDEIKLVPEIKEVELRGVNDKEVEVAVDVHKMMAADIAFDDIINAINFENKTISGGSITDGKVRKNIRVIGEFSSPNELNEVIVKHFDNIPIYLKNIATIKFKEKESTTFAREYGLPVVMLDVMKKSGQNMITASESINKIIDRAKDTYLPRDLNISITNDQSIRTENAVNDLVNNIIFGVLLVIGVLTFFLGIRNALLVGLAIPLSMLMSYIVLKGMGITLNTMVLFALVMGLGMLVDDAVVVIENIYALMAKGIRKKEAAIRGVSEVAWPVISSTVTTLAAFFPLGLWPGIMGEFMIYFPMTLSVVLLSSSFVAVIINPMLASVYMKVEEVSNSRKVIRIRTILFALGGFLLTMGYVADSRFLRGTGNLLILSATMMFLYKLFLGKMELFFKNRFLPFLERNYKILLHYALYKKRAYTFFFGTFGLLFLSFVLFGMFPPKVNFFPVNFPNQIIVYMEYPEGTDINKTNSLCKKVEQRTKEVVSRYIDPATGKNFMVESVIAQVGEGAGNANDIGGQSEMPHKAKVTILLREFKYRRGISSSDVMEEVRQNVQGFPGVKITVDKDRNGPPAGYPINIEISGIDYHKMLKDAEDLTAYINSQKVPGIERLSIDVNLFRPELQILIDRIEAQRLGLSSSRIGSDLRRSIYGEKASVLKMEDDDYPINVRLEENLRNNSSMLFNQTIFYRNMETGKIYRVPIASLIKTKEANSFNVIKRKNLKRIINVYSNVVEGYNGNEIVQTLKQKLKHYKLSSGNSFKFSGEQEEQEKNMSFLLNALFIGSAAILLILVAQFNSMGESMIILVSIVLSLIGVFLGLTIFNMDFIIIMTMMGIISLAGIVVNNAIVLIDYTKLLFERKRQELGLGEDDLLPKEVYYEIIIEGGVSRLRPVLLTAITTVLGLIPLAIGFNIDFFSLLTDLNPRIYLGGDNVIFWGPLAWTVIFGMTFATFLTLVIVPVMFYLLKRAQIRFNK